MMYIFIFLVLLAVELIYFKMANHFNIIDNPMNAVRIHELR